MNSYPSIIAICSKGKLATLALSYIQHLIYLRSPNIQIVACPNRDDKGFDTWYPSLTKHSKLLDISIESLDVLEKIPDLLLLSLEFDEIIKVERFSSHRLYNIHFSKLPSYRGVYTSILPILNGENETGVTLHEIDEGIDSGAIIAQKTFEIKSYTTARQLYEMYMDEAFQLLIENIDCLMKQNYRAIPQQQKISSYYRRKDVDIHSLSIDLTQTSEEISRFVRAFCFPEFQLPKLNGRCVKACNLIKEELENVTAGSRIKDTPYSSLFVCGDKKAVEIIWA